MVIKDKLTEAAFTKMVIALAHALGWRCAHFRASMNRRGKWSTAVQGDGAGFPDLVMVRGSKMIAAELKVGRNKTTWEQDWWIEAFNAAGVEAFVWRPEQWPEIERVLR